MAVTETKTTGFLGNLMNSILAIPIGILLFLASFVVLFMNEGRTDWSKVGERAVELAATDTAGTGALVSVTGPLSTAETLGDSPYLQAGSYLVLEREAEMFAWIEDSSTETTNNTGGSTTTRTTYTYRTDWTDSPENSSNFREGGHDNPPMGVTSQSYSAVNGTVGMWPLTTAEATMPGASDLAVDASMLAPGLAGAQIVSGFVYLNGADPNSPDVGDIRISWNALAPGGTVTAFGQAAGGRLVTAETSEGRWFRILNGDRPTALSSLRTEYVAMGWILRVVGFLMMWFGMSMVFAPLHAIAGILPFLKKGTTFLINLITFPIALVLTTITVVISMILNNWIAMVVVALLFGGIVALLFTMRKKGSDTPAPMGMPPGPPPGMPFGPPPGPPPGAPPGMPPGPPPA
jgi:hypothetical protein